MAFPLWFVWALAGHLANGVSFIIDKTLLRKSFKRPATYAGMIGIMGVLALVLIPFGVHLPNAEGWFWMAISGSTFVVSLWIFFGALASGEASRVVPVVGSLIPVLTLGGTAMALGERLNANQYVGFGCLILATILLAGGAAGSRLNASTIRLAVLSAALFAISSITAKISYDGDGFITAFTISRVWGAVTAAVLLVSDPAAVKELTQSLFGSPYAKRSKNAGGRGALMLVFIGQSLGSLGFVGVQYATSLGSAALVNALQAVQYALLVVVAFVLRKRAPELLGEDLTVSTIIRKVIAIVIVGIGLWLVV